jgi:hypothetical protein
MQQTFLHTASDERPRTYHARMVKAANGDYLVCMVS